MLYIGIDGSRAIGKNKTGIGWYSFYLIKALEKISARINDLKFILYINKPLSSLSDEERQVPLNWEIHFLSWPFKFFWTQIRFSWQMVKSPPDILFVPAHSLPLIHAPLNVLTIHDLGFERFPHLYSKKERLLLRFSYYFGSKWAKKIIVPSEFTKKELIHFYKINPSKIVSIPLAYEKDTFFPWPNFSKEDKKILSRFQINFPYFLYVGRIDRKKNVPFLISAYQRFTETFPSPPKLVLIGPDSLKIKKNFIVKLPYLPHNQLAAFYRQALAFVFPSLYEGFGLPLLEAMASGTPAIVSRIPPFLEIGKNAPLYFSPYDKEQLVYLLGEVAYNSSLRKKMSSQGLEIAKNYSWQKCADQTLKLLLECRGGTPTSPCSGAEFEGIT